MSPYHLHLVRVPSGEPRVLRQLALLLLAIDFVNTFLLAQLTVILKDFGMMTEVLTLNYFIIKLIYSIDTT